MAEPLENKQLPSEQVSTEALIEWITKVVKSGKGDVLSLQQIKEEIGGFQKYQTEVYLPVLGAYGKAIRNSSTNERLFATTLLSLAAMMFVGGYIEGKQRQIEVNKLNDLFDKNTPENH